MRFSIYDADDNILATGELDGLLFTASEQAIVSVKGTHDVEIIAGGDAHHMVVTDETRTCELLLGGTHIPADASTIHFPAGLYTAVEGSLVL